MTDPNGPFHRHTKEYHDLQIERELARLYGRDYPALKQARDVLARLEPYRACRDNGPKCR